jgi:hypothetical protein
VHRAALRSSLMLLLLVIVVRRMLLAGIEMGETTEVKCQ